MNRRVFGARNLKKKNSSWVCLTAFSQFPRLLLLSLTLEPFHYFPQASKATQQLKQLLWLE